jgi:hypothetical protein
MVHRREVGPKPCPVGALTVEIIADSLSTLQDRTIIRNAATLAESMCREDGVEGACAAFYKHLPLENMLCDVSLFRGEYRLAQVLTHQTSPTALMTTTIAPPDHCASFYFILPHRSTARTAD